MHPERLQQPIHLSRSELRSIVGDNHLRTSMSVENALCETLNHSGGSCLA